MKNSKDKMSSIESLKGFTLIEVIIAMVLLTIGSLALLSVLGGGLLQRATAEEYDIARNAAAGKIEEIRGYEFLSTVATSAVSGTYFAILGLTAPATSTITTWLQPLPGRIEVNNSSADLYEVTITIRWRIKGNANPSVYNELITRSFLTRKNKY
jgi:prepilin-type N-terminal cleavage/methylation domain-containing protein